MTTETLNYDPAELKKFGDLRNVARPSGDAHRCSRYWREARRTSGAKSRK